MKNYFVSFNALNEFSEYCFLVDKEGTILDVNKAVILDIKVAKEEMQGTQFYTWLHPASILKAENALIRANQNSGTIEIECKLRLYGELFCDSKMYFSCFTLPNDSKKQKVLIIGKNVTEEKKREADLLRFYFVAQNTVNPLQITDLSGKMIYVNPAFVKASGYSEEELIGKNPSVFGSKKYPRKFWDKMWNTITSGKVWVGEVENRKKNGDAFHTQLLVSPIINNDKQVIGFFGIHRDLTEKRNFEKQLIHTQKMESIGTLAAGVAHEVGNPLASISALVQLILRTSDDPFTKEKLDLVKSQINRISKIIRDLVDFSRPSNYEMRLTDLNANVKESIEIVQVGKKAKNITFKSDFDQNIAPIPLVADQLQQVFVNILINAVDSVADKIAQSEDYKGVIKIKTSFDSEHVYITFEDNGLGIDEASIVKIFEPFFTTKKEGKGTGLGLWVSIGIIQSFGGEIKVNSIPGEWTRFTVQLPIYTNY
ncbi:MAG: PAS domain S-box protein [Ignavibacteriaceae bacterium]|nr:PAS domain S-box protein [Ignavibacteriaceae bacterium]